jgi:hypothetical protein
VPQVSTDNGDPASSLCPHCQCEVDNEATRCHECGGVFPALRHRKGEVRWGAVCGLVRGLFMIAVMATMVAVANLFTSPFTLWSVVFWKVPIITVCVIAAIFFNSLTRRCHERAYHVR